MIGEFTVKIGAQKLPGIIWSVVSKVRASVYPDTAPRIRPEETPALVVQQIDATPRAAEPRDGYDLLTGTQIVELLATVSAEEGLARTLAREGARAFVASTDQNSAEAAMNSVIAAGGRKLGLTDGDFSRMAVGLECSASPCFSPNGKVTVTIHFGATKEFPAVTSSAQEYISPWA